MPLDYEPEDAATAWPAKNPDGTYITYEAVLLAVEDTFSKRKPNGSGGNPMQVWTFEVYHPDGRTQTIKEYVSLPGATFKVKQLAAALGRLADFNVKRFQADDYLRSNVNVSLSVEESVGFDDKNRIGRFLAAADQAPAAAPPAPQPPPARRDEGESTFDQPSRERRPATADRPPARSHRGPLDAKPQAAYPRAAGQVTAPAEPPFGEEEQFKEDDIPFAWQGRVSTGNI